MNIVKTAVAASLLIVGFSAQAEPATDMTDYLAQQVAEQTQRVVMELGRELQQSAATLLAESIDELASAGVAADSAAELAGGSEPQATTDVSVLIAGR